MSANDPEFKQPPWVYGPKETMEWIESVYPSKKGKKHKKKSREKILSNIHRQFDFDLEKIKIKPKTFFSKIIGESYFDEKIDLISTTEIILRALAKAKFKHNLKIILDKKIHHDHSEISSDFKEAIDKLKAISSDVDQGKTLEVIAKSEEPYECIIEITTKKVHKEQEPAIDLAIKGIIKEKTYHEFLNYLKENLKIKEVIIK